MLMMMIRCYGWWLNG